jgi:hypothetical protein
VDLLREWIPKRLPGVLVTGTPLGLAESLARMVTLADTPLCARIDADDINTPDRLERQVAFLDSHPYVAAVGGQMLLIDENGEDLGPVAKLPLSDADIVGDMLDGPGMAHPTVLFRRDAVLGAGNYRDVGPVNVEDYDLWLRLAVRHRLANLDTPVLRYRIHDRSSTVIAERQGHLRAAVRARLAISGPALFGCSVCDATRLAANRHPLALIPLTRIARHLGVRSGISACALLRSITFVQGARTLLAPWDLLSLVVLWTLEKRPHAFVKRVWHKLRKTP